MRTIRDVNVCVVGGAGFLGSHLVDHLINDRHCKVLVVDNLSSGFKKFVHPQARFEHADITGSEEQLTKLFRAYKTQFVFNYAASPYIPVSFDRPLHVFNINATGALKVINAAWESGCEAILQVSSAEIYGEGEKLDDSGSWQRIDEETIVRPHSSYGAAKAAIDAMAQVRWKEAKVPVIALRQFNCVGERETHPYVVPEIISQIYKELSNEIVVCVDPPPPVDLSITVKLGNNSFRDFQYAGDAVRMATELLEKGKFGEVYNMGSESGIQIYDLAKLIGSIMGVEVQVKEDPSRVRPWEIWHLQSDNSKLYEVIETPPVVPFREALEKTVEYFYSNNRRWDWE